MQELGQSYQQSPTSSLTIRSNLHTARPQDAYEPFSSAVAKANVMFLRCLLYCLVEHQEDSFFFKLPTQQQQQELGTFWISSAQPQALVQQQLQPPCITCSQSPWQEDLQGNSMSISLAAFHCQGYALLALAQPQQLGSAAAQAKDITLLLMPAACPFVEQSF